MSHFRGMFVSSVLLVALGICISIRAQVPSGASKAGVDGHPDSMDAVKGAPKQYLLRYEDSHVRLIEVTLRPGAKAAAPVDDPYPAVLAMDAVQAKTKNTETDPNSPLSTSVGRGMAPKGMDFPMCMTTGAEPVHQPENVDTFPAHYYRIEFKRIDGDDFKTNWSKWYPYMDHRTTVWEWLRSPGVERPYGQAIEPTFSGDGSARTVNPDGFPYPDKYDSFRVAPGQHWLRYQDAHVRFLEVIYRAGETGDALHGHPYASVFAHDAPGATATDEHLDPDTPINGQNQGHGPAPRGMKFPTCDTMGPQAPHRPHDTDTVPFHFYRIEFRRVDGQDFKTNWAKWYPSMAK
jgi:hypothetical protein